MKILSIRRGFLADHSSTSYEFLAVDKPLSNKARAEVRRLSSRVRPTARRANFVYHAEGYDIPGGWGALMAKYYDVMYSESYDWWTLAMAFSTTNKDLVDKIRKYEFSGVEDLGVDVSCRNKRVVVTINCRMDPNYMYHDSDEGWDEEEDQDEDDQGAAVVVTDDSLLDLLVRIRDRLKKGDCQALYAVWEIYGLEEDDDEEEHPPKPKRNKAGASVADELSSILAPME